MRFVLSAKHRLIAMDNQSLNAGLKNDLDHKHIDLEYLIARTKLEAATAKVQKDVEVAERLVKYYEDNMHSELVFPPKKERV